MANLIFQYKTGEGTLTPTTFIRGPGRTLYQSSSGYTNFTEVTGNPNESTNKHHYVLNGDQTEVILWTGGNGTFDRYSHSTDGINYTEFNIPNSYGANGVVWHNNKWYSIDRLQAGGFQVSHSTDGINWSIETGVINLTGLNPQSSATHGLVSNAGNLILASTDGDPAIIASNSSGTTWDCPICPSGCSISPEYIPANNYLTGLWRTQNENTLIVGTQRGSGGHSIWTSWDAGCSWVQGYSVPAFETWGQVISAAGLVFAVSTESGQAVYKSTNNGIGWTNVTALTAQTSSAAMSYHSSYGWLYTAGNATTQWKWSADGTTWNSTNVTSASTGWTSFTLNL